MSTDTEGLYETYAHLIVQGVKLACYNFEHNVIREKTTRRYDLLREQANFSSGDAPSVDVTA